MGSSSWDTGARYQKDVLSFYAFANRSPKAEREDSSEKMEDGERMRKMHTTTKKGTDRAKRGNKKRGPENISGLLLAITFVCQIDFALGKRFIFAICHRTFEAP